MFAEALVFVAASCPGNQCNTIASTVQVQVQQAFEPKIIYVESISKPLFRPIFKKRSPQFIYMCPNGKCK
jgi:hypothetical protein